MTCCWIGCGEEAEFEIQNVSPGADYYDFTQACEVHVGALLGSNNESPGVAWEVHCLTRHPRPL